VQVADLVFAVDSDDFIDVDFGSLRFFRRADAGDDAILVG
jgi:hypothetical protein